jgi:hypothetical protein
MPTTVAAAFAEFLNSLRATPTETAAAKSHRLSIEAKLSVDFGMTAFFRSGSFGNGTNISGFSDVDYFAVIPSANLNFDSSYALSEVADALRQRFSTTPNIRVNGLAIRLPFGLDGAHATEVVPVYPTGFTRLGFRQFEMPDGAGRWMFASPESHNAYVADIDQRLSGSVKPLVRFLKAWKYARSVPIKSFYLEILTAHYCYGERSIMYDVDVKRLFERMWRDQLAALSDPRFPNDGFQIQCANTILQTVDALNAVGRALTWATEAVSLNQAGRVAAAFDRWRLVFNNAFPPYG